MELLKKIENDMKDALKSDNKIVSSTLRMLKSDIMYEKTKGSKDLTDEKVLEIVTRAAKKRKESINEYEKASRNDLAEKEKQELEVIKKYLPEQLSEEDISKYIDEKLEELGDVSKSNFPVKNDIIKLTKFKVKRGHKWVKKTVKEELEKEEKLKKKKK